MPIKKESRHSLKTQTIITNVVLIFTTWALMTFILVHQMFKTGRQNIYQTINLTADKKAQELNNSFDAVENAVTSAYNYITRTLDEKRFDSDLSYQESYLNNLTQEMISLATFSKDIITVYIRMNIEKYGGTTGFFLENTKSGFVSVRPTDLSQYSPTDLEHTAWYYIPVWKREPVWTSAYDNKNINVQMISYVIPMYSNGELLGIVGMDINLSSIKEIINDLPLMHQQALLIGQEKKLVYDTDAIQQNTVEQSANVTILMDNFDEHGYQSIQHFNWGNQRLVGVIRELSNEMKLVVSIPERQIYHAQQELLRPLILTTLLIIIFTIILLFLAIKKIISPISIISNATFKLSRGELNIKIPYHSNNELGRLTDNIRMMTSQMQDYIDHIQEQTKRERQAKESAQAESNSKSQFLASMYLSLHEIDLNNDVFTEITCRSDIAQAIGPTHDQARLKVRRVMEQKVGYEGQSRLEFMEFINFDTLNERMKDRITIAQEFISNNGAWCRARFILMDKNEDGSLHRVLWAVEDISQERLERDRLENEIAKSVAASQAKSAFLANMSHEIRTPINAVIGMNEMILRESQNQSILTYAGNIKTASLNLLSIVNDILDFSKIEAGKMELLPENYDISSLVVDLVNMITSRTKKKNLAFNLAIDPTMPKTLYGDSVRIKQCILNLLTNAVKYTSRGSVSFTLTYKKIDDNHILLQVAVEDTGIGIKKADMERLYSPFERIDEKDNKTIEGTGLGISIVKKFLAMMDSKLEVTSTYGEGSLFSFSVKQQVVDWQETGEINRSYHKNRAKMEKYREAFHAPQARILFVDDTDINLEVVKGLLKKTEINIDTALSGKEALEKVKTTSYDILFIDHRMPEMDGIETFHAMKAMGTNMSAGKPCIALTANAISGARQMYLDEGFDDYLSKPVNPERLMDIIKKFLPRDKIEDTSEGSSSQEVWPETRGDHAPKKEDTPVEKEDFLSRLSAIAQFDTRQGLANCGSGALFETTVRTYFSLINDKQSELDVFLKNKDFKNYGIKVHALKSSSRLIGLTTIADEAAHLEQCADSGKTSEIQEKHPVLMDHVNAIKAAVNFILSDTKQGGETQSKSGISEADLASKIREIEKAADFFDIDALDKLIQELSGINLPDYFKDTFAKIRSCVDNIDYKSIKTILEEYNKS